MKTVISTLTLILFTLIPITPTHAEKFFADERYEAQWVQQTNPTTSPKGASTDNTEYFAVSPCDTINFSATFQNIGSIPWEKTGTDQVAFNIYKDPKVTSYPPTFTWQPGISESYFEHTSWLTPYRVGTITENQVLPGQEGTIAMQFNIPCSAQPGLYREDISMAAGDYWMPNSINGDPLGVAHIWVGFDIQTNTITPNPSETPNTPTPTPSETPNSLTPTPSETPNTPTPTPSATATTTTFLCGNFSISATELELYERIMDYRSEKSLPQIPLSPDLTTVARTHIQDVQDNNPITDTCNLHSWSDQGTWSSVCYTSDHANAEGMWQKPKELTDYPNNGYEISYWHSNQATPAGALTGWQNSPGHNAVIINEDIWESHPWQAIGIGINGQYAMVWFGEAPDPQSCTP